MFGSEARRIAEAARVKAEKAEQDALSAASAIREHERVCTERWNEARRAWIVATEGIQKIRESQITMWRWALGIFVSISGTVVVAFIFLIFRALSRANII